MNNELVIVAALSAALATTSASYPASSLLLLAALGCNRALRKWNVIRLGVRDLTGLRMAARTCHPDNN